MIEPNRKEVVESWFPYFRQIADLMGLKDWEVCLDEKPADSDAILSVSCWTGRHGCIIRMGQGFFEETPEEQRQSVIHEFIHCHFAAADGIIHDYIKEDALADAWSRMMEYAVDGLSSAMVRDYPLPSDDKEDESDKKAADAALATVQELGTVDWETVKADAGL